jgi:hypothetical protein
MLKFVLRFWTPRCRANPRTFAVCPRQRTFDACAKYAFLPTGEVETRFFPLDPSAFIADIDNVSDAKKTPEVKTQGTKIAEKARNRANGYSDARRQGLLDKGLAIIYGGADYAKANRGRS